MNNIRARAHQVTLAAYSLIAVAALAATVLTTTMIVSAESNDPDWEVAPTGLTAAAGDEAGRLDINWDPHSQTTKTLSDYRVTWTPEGEDFKHYSETGWSAYPTSNELTVTGLDTGAAHSVRVRARYDDNKKSRWSDVVTAQAGAAPNAAATGQPVITGTVQVGKTLTADTSAIADADGLSNVSYSYQWVKNGGSTDTYISGATDSSHTLTEDQEGRTIRVKVSFTDDAGNEATLTSAATGAVQPRPGTPVILGTVRVGETLTANTSDVTDSDGMENAVFAYQWVAGGADIEGATGPSYTIAAGDEGLVIQVWLSFTDDGGNPETRISEGTETVQPPPNTPATGAPTISGTAEVGDTLTVDTSGISDAEGMANAVYTYRWMAGGTDIQGAAGPSYTLTGDDEGLTIQVWVGFTDDAGNPEALTSAATGAVALKEPPPAPGNLTAAVNADGSVTLTWDAPNDDRITGYQILRRDRDTDAAGDFTIIEDDTGTNATTHTDDTMAPSTRYVYRVKARNAHGLSQSSQYVRATTPARPTPVQDADATRDGATELGDITETATPAILAGTLDGSGDTVDYWRFSLTGTKQVRLGLQDQDTDADLILEDAGGDLLAESRTAGTADESIEATLDEGTYYLRAEAQELGENAFNLRYEAIEGATDPTLRGEEPSDKTEPGARADPPDDHGQTRATATGIPVGDPAVTGTIGSATDRDWFTAWMTSVYAYPSDENQNHEERYRADIDVSASGALAADDVELQVFYVDYPGDPSGNYVVLTEKVVDTATDVVPFYFYPSRNGPGFLEVSSAGGNTGGYSLSLVRDGTVPGDMPPDPKWWDLLKYGDALSNPGGSAAEIAVGANATGELETPGDADWFSITMEASTTYTIELDVTAGGPVRIAGLLDGDGDLLAEASNHGSGRGTGDGEYRDFLEYTADSAGDYYLLVAGYNSGGYEVSVTEGTVAVDDYTVDDTAPGYVIVGSSATGSIDSSWDADGFLARLVAGYRYRIDAEGSATSKGTLANPKIHNIGHPLGYRVRAGGDLIQDDDGGTGFNSRLEYKPRTTGFYNIRVASSGLGKGTYTLSVTVLDGNVAGTGTAGRAIINGEVTGDVGFAGDVDWFRVELARQGNYRIDLKGADTSEGTLADPMIHGIYNPAGNRISGTTDDNGGTDNNSQKVFVPNNRGHHYIAVGASGTGTGTYTLSVLDNIDRQPENSGTTARLKLGVPKRSRVNSNGEKDWFRVAFVDGLSYRIHVNGSPTGDGTLGNPVLSGISSNGTTFISGSFDNNGGTGNNAQEDFTADVTGDHYVGVGGSGTSQGTYTVLVKAIDKFQADETTTGVVEIGGFITGRIDPANDVDWIKVSIPNAGVARTFRIDVEGRDTGRGSLEDPLLKELVNDTETNFGGSTDDNGGVGRNSRLVMNTFPGFNSSYHIAVSAAGTGTGTYRVSVFRDNASSDSLTTAEITLGTEYVGEIELERDRDWLKAALTTGKTYPIHLLGSSTGAGTLSDPIITGVYRADGRRIRNTLDDNGGIGTNSLVLFTPNADADYFIEVGGVRYATGTYRLFIPTDDYPGDTSTHGVLSDGVTLAGNIETVTDLDWFRADMVTGRKYEFGLLGARADPDSALTLNDPKLFGIYDADGNLISGTTETDNNDDLVHSQYTATVDGPHYYSVGNEDFYDPSATGTYRIAFSDITVSGGDIPGDTTTREVVVADGAEAGSDITDEDDRDWFKVEFESGKTYRIYIRGESYDVDAYTLEDPYLYGIYDSDGTLIPNTTMDDGGLGADSQLDYTATTTGEHYISVGLSPGSSLRGNYGLVVTDISQ